ncbi:TetR/AcrR family transcriptional regulator [Streptomycetaceae bacterium NBC_01309]
MGLRELKATRTRRQIVESALDLFIDQGYDATTMEQIAERAEVGSTTLYRYFPSKDLLILEPLARSMDLAAKLRERPAEEPLDLALGAVIHAALDGADDEDGRIAEIRRIIDAAPVPRARLWDVTDGFHRELTRAIAERLDRPADDPLVTMTAHVTFAVFRIAAETWWDGDHSVASSAVVDGVLRGLSGVVPVIPAPSPRLAT